jgi:hypothetical protein
MQNAHQLTRVPRHTGFLRTSYSTTVALPMQPQDSTRNSAVHARDIKDALPGGPASLSFFSGRDL